METYVTVQGNLTADPVATTTASGASLVKIRVASNARRFDKQSGEYRDMDPMFINATCWRNLGSHVLATLRKGDSVIVHGRLLYREYDDTKGVHRTQFEIDALVVGPDLNRCAADLRRPSRATAEAPPTPAEVAA
ncbi:MAG TPA: single-stranded DNA-binding protein [Mycobacteriales bacterium]|nr:single-stranded DNA-binding protein [Mycobacteriales bacterium]